MWIAWYNCLQKICISFYRVMFYSQRILYLAMEIVCYIGWEEWTPWWEAKAKSGEGEVGTAAQECEHPAHAHTSTSHDSCYLCCTSSRSSPGQQVGSFYQLPRSSNVAVHASCCCRHIPGSRPPPTCRLSWGRPEELWACNFSARSVFHFAIVDSISFYWGLASLCWWLKRRYCGLDSELSFVSVLV